MWLDRLTTGATTPSGSITPSRGYSPSPRKSTHLAPGPRTGLGLSATRSSTSLDLSTNTSTASLASTTRLTNGSSLRFEQRPPPDVPDPVTVLRSILGTSEDDRSSALRSSGGTEDGREGDIDFAGLGLEDFLAEDGPAPRPATDGGSRGVTAYDSRQKYEDFHRSIAECDQVLETVETYLTNFKTELGQVSAEIENLQARSVQLNAKLDNRRNVEKRLGPAVEDISLSPVTVRAIAEGPVDQVFARALHDVETKAAVIDAQAPTADSVRAMQDLKPLLGDLKARAVERIRDYVVAQIKALRSPNINAQVIQQQALVRHRDLYVFLARNHAVLAEEIGQAYVNTMKWYYASHFGRYRQSLDSLHIHLFDQHDLLGSEAAPAKRTVLGGSKAAPPQHDSFGLGRRGDILRPKDDTALPAYLVEDSKTAQYLEMPFRHFNQALVDNVCAEYFVATELFSTSSLQHISRRVADILEPTFSLGHSLTKQLVETTNDCLGVLLCVRLNQHFAFELQRRKVPVADAYINYTNMLLWPRFQMVMDAHCESLKKVPTATGRGAAAALALVSGTADTSRASVAPHAITQRFGQFLEGILLVSADAGDDEPVANSLARLRTEYESLMGKLAKGAGDATRRNKFLYNNYSLVLTIISDTKGKLADDQKAHFGAAVRDLKGR